jgi:kelch-like protein 10
MNLILDFVYTGSVDINQKNVCSLLESASYLGILDLVELCCDFLKRMLTLENCIGIMRFASYHSSSLNKYARCIVTCKFEILSQQSDEYLELPSEELEAIIGAGELNVKSEEVVWNGVLRWINHDIENRKGNIVELIKKVRLELLDRKFVLENIKDHPHVAGNDECRAIISDALKSLHSLEMITEKEGDISNRGFSRPRIGHDTLFVFPTSIRSFHTKDFPIYDTLRMRWVKVEVIEVPPCQRDFRTAVIGFNIYIIGGSSPRLTPVNSCHCFNTVAKTWCEVSPMQNRRSELTVAVLDGLVYAMGGFSGHDYCNTAERYDYRTNQWYMVAPMNEQRGVASATNLNGKIYVVGGFSHGKRHVASAEVYDPEVNQWTYIAEMTYARSCLSCIAYHGYVYAIGGRNDESSMCSGEKYNPTTNEWMQISDMPRRRKYLSTAVLGDKIFAIGGYPFTKVVDCYNEKSNEWTTERDIIICDSYQSACVIMDLPNVCDFIEYNKGEEEGRSGRSFWLQISRPVLSWICRMYATLLNIYNKDGEEGRSGRSFWL